MGNEENKAVCNPCEAVVDPMLTYNCNDVTAVDKGFYDRIIAAKGNRTLVREEVLQPFTGDAYFLKAGQIIRLEQRESRTQIIDLKVITPDLKQYGSFFNSMIFGGMDVDVYKQIWSQSKYVKPLATVVANEVPDGWAAQPGHYVRPHFWGGHCAFDWNELGEGRRKVMHNNCHMNFLHALNRLPAIHAIQNEEERRRTVERLAESENINLFQPLAYYGFEDALSGEEFPCPPLPYGTGVEFYAEQDIYVLLSNCPFGDQSAAVTTENVPVPLYVGVYETGIAPKPAYEVFNWEEAFYEAVARGEIDISVKNDT